MAVSQLLRSLARSRGAGWARRQTHSNRRWRNPSAVLLLSALSSLLFFPLGCANPETVTHVAAQAIQVSSELAPDQVLNRHLEGDPRTLDPSLAEDVVGEFVLDDLFEGLVTLDEDGSTIPGVATSWETSADGKTWTFHLREDARWSNGQPVTADDFVYAWRREGGSRRRGPNTRRRWRRSKMRWTIAAGKMPVDKLGVESIGPRTLDRPSARADAVPSRAA